MKLVEELLLSEEEDATVMAHSILRAINEKREGERTFAVLLFKSDTNRFHSVWGPFPSKATAQRAVTNGAIIASRECWAQVIPLIDPNTEEE